MKKTITFLSVILSTIVHGEYLTVNGTKINVAKIKFSNQKVITAILEDTATIRLGKNVFENIPSGTRLYFHENNSVDDDLNLAGLIVNAPMKDQTWHFPNGLKLTLNCGKFGGSPSFIDLNPKGELLKGCFSAVDQTLNNLVIGETSNLEFFDDGQFKAATKVSGSLKINENEVKLADEMSLRYHSNKNLNYFHPAPGESFEVPTEISDKTAFLQPEDQEIFPVIFHENGTISTAILADPSMPTTTTVEMFGTPIEFQIKSGPIGFNEIGLVDRLALTRNISFRAGAVTYVRSTEINYGVTRTGYAEPGREIAIKSGEQLFLDSTEEKKVLRGYTSDGSNGLQFFNELSAVPF
jgi:hypothetical protein